MLKKTAQGLMVLAALIGSTGGAQARDIFKVVQADVFVLGGASTLVDPNYFPSAGRLFHSRFDMGTKFSIGVSVPYGKLLSIESAYTYGPNNLFVTNTNLFPHVPVEYQAHTYMGSLAAVVHAPFAVVHFKPYVEGGIEYDRFSPTQAAITLAKNQGFGAVSTAIINRNDKFGFNFGAGVDRKIFKRLSLRIDLRDHVTSSPAFGLPPQSSQASGTAIATFPIKGRANNIVYTAGIVFHLGKL